METDEFGVETRCFMCGRHYQVVPEFILKSAFVLNRGGQRKDKRR